MKLSMIALGGTIGLLTACGHGIVTDGPVGPTTSTDTTHPPTTVQRAALTVRVTFDASDASIASAAGLSTAGLSVRITRTAPGFAPKTATTADDGTVRFDNLLEGVYQLSVERALTAQELSRLSPADREASLFAGGVDAILQPPNNASKEVPLVGNRRGSLVISEMFPLNSPLSTNLGYGLGTYLEVYNNSDTTVYLDGVLLFRTPLNLHGGWPEYPCDSYNKVAREDSTAMYSGSVMQAFPGSGSQYPIKPGEAKVVAMDALDHRAAAPGMEQVDLSRAEFEQIGSSADIDNPFSADMVNVYAGTGIFGRGYPFMTAEIAYVLALPAARAAVTIVPLINTYGTAPSLGTPSNAYRVPRQYVLDVLAAGSVHQGPGGAGGVTCSPFLSPVFDRAKADLVNARVSIAVSRKSLGFTPDGREILQRTRTSARDFEYARPLRRSLDK